MIKKAALISFVVLAFSCSSDKKPKKPDSHYGAIGADGTPVITTGPNGEIISGDADGTPLSLVPDTGSSMRFLDARALTVYYANIFPKGANGFEHCRNTLPRDPVGCFDSIFDINEKASMGSFDLGNPRMDRSKPNVNPTVNLTLNYTRTLRAALTRECKNLIAIEQPKGTALPLATNILWKADAPTAATLIEFEKKLLGIAGTPIAIDINADAYVAAFDQVNAANKDKTKAVDFRRDAYINTCIALAMDPLVFIY